MHFANEGEGSSVVKDYKQIIQKSKNEVFRDKEGKGSIATSPAPQNVQHWPYFYRPPLLNLQHCGLQSVTDC